MLEELILSEFNEKDYTIFEQQILDLDLPSSEVEHTLKRILKSKSKSLQDKFFLLLQEKKLKILENAFKRARKRYKTMMTLRFMRFEQNEFGE
ncbi:MAG: hypothetical protein ACTSYB_17825 [Candidatus Helarchaeota archaeon]